TRRRIRVALRRARTHRTIAFCSRALARRTRRGARRQSAVATRRRIAAQRRSRVGLTAGCIAVRQRGDRRRARALLVARANLPNGSVSAAYLQSFDRKATNVSKRRTTSKRPAFRTLLGDMTSLTKREEEVAHLVLKGLTNRAIARELAISEHTVESHMTSIMN